MKIHLFLFNEATTWGFYCYFILIILFQSSRLKEVSAQYKKGPHTDGDQNSWCKTQAMGCVSAPERQGDSSHALRHFYFKEGIIRGLKREVLSLLTVNLSKEGPLNFYEL